MFYGSKISSLLFFTGPTCFCLLCWVQPYRARMHCESAPFWTQRAFLTNIHIQTPSLPVAHLSLQCRRKLQIRHMSEEHGRQ